MGDIKPADSANLSRGRLRNGLSCQQGPGGQHQPGQQKAQQHISHQRNPMQSQDKIRNQYNRMVANWQSVRLFFPTECAQIKDRQVLAGSLRGVACGNNAANQRDPGHAA